MTGKTLRFINFLLDTAIYMGLMIVFMLVFRDTVAQEDIKWISVVCYFLYYFLFEVFAGQTPGKFLTRSKVVSLPGTEGHNFRRILFRTLMRFIPLDMFSYLFGYRGLHDWVSKTTIINLL